MLSPEKIVKLLDDIERVNALDLTPEEKGYAIGPAMLECFGLEGLLSTLAKPERNSMFLQYDAGLRRWLSDNHLGADNDV